MIATFYDKNLKKMQNNSSLTIDNDSFNLIKRPIEMNELSFICEKYAVDIQPTFVVIEDDLGRYIYGSLAGIPIVTNENKTEVNGTDIKSMLSSDILLNYGQNTYVKSVIEYIFNQWNIQINNYENTRDGDIDCELRFVDYSNYDEKYNIENIKLDLLMPESGLKKYNALEELQAYLKQYDLYLDTKIDFSTLIFEQGHYTYKGKVIFTIGRIMFERENQNIKLWEYNITNYGKWMADINEAQGYYADANRLGSKWILNTDNVIKRVNLISGDLDTGLGINDLIRLLNNASKDKYSIIDIFYLDKKYLLKEAVGIVGIAENYVRFDGIYNIALERYGYVQIGWYITKYVKGRDIYPVKKSIIEVNDIADIDIEAIKELANNRYQEDIEISTKDIPEPKFETQFSIYTQKGKELYKILPCGELRYNASGLHTIQIGFRYTTIDFI